MPWSKKWAQPERKPKKHKKYSEYPMPSAKGMGGLKSIINKLARQLAKSKKRSLFSRGK